MEATAPNPIIAKLHQHRSLVFPVWCIAMLMVFLVPLPTQVLDLLLVLNLTVSIMVMVTTIYVKSPLEFAVLPSLLLAVTLFRLTLNVATTRLILTVGDRASTPEEAVGAAGQMVSAFSEFVSGGSLVVGIIIFIIIFIIQFVVITKGATRISEVAARFTLDAMPGKQMAIDADLNSGSITEAQARERRDAISQEADFYGAMDGASKFVRGDAIAGIVITLVNIAGGMFIGLVQMGWEIGPTAELYTRLTIGDGLVSQVPAFVVALGAGLIVTRSSSKNELGEEVLSQMTARPVVLMVVAAFLLMLSITGLPWEPLLVVGACCGGLSWMLTRSNNRKAATALATEARDAQTAAAKEPDKPEKLLDIDPMELEVGVGLIRLIDESKGGDLLHRISIIRRQVAVDLGIVVPPIRIRDNVQLEANDYAIKIRNEVLARGETFPDQFLAMDNGTAVGGIDHAYETKEPAFGLPAYWITESQQDEAERKGYMVVEASAVLATHITEVVRTHAHRLLTRQETRNLLDNLKERAPALLEEVIGPVVKPGEVQQVLKNLLRERVPVRDLETILETLGDYGTRIKDLEVLTEYCRNALARTICKQYIDESDGKIWCITLDPAAEDVIAASIQRTESGSSVTLPPSTRQVIVRKVSEAINELTSAGKTPVVLTNPVVRSTVRRILEGSLPQTAVLGYNEVVSDVPVEAAAVVGLNA